MQIIAIANQKGGVAKTTSSAAIGDLLAQSGRRVLMVDLDPQASLTQGQGFYAHGASMADVIGGAERGRLEIQQIIKSVSVDLDLAPADIDLAQCEVDISERRGRENIVKDSLRYLDYDVVIIDCPPSLQMLSINALTAARGVIVPTLPVATDLRGVKIFMDTFQKIKKSGLNSSLDLIGILLVQYDPKDAMHLKVERELKWARSPIIGYLPTSKKVIQEASAALQSVTAYAPESKLAQAYMEVEKKVVQWLRKQR